MRLKIFLCLLCVVVLAGCSKKDEMKPDDPAVEIPKEGFYLASVFQSDMVIQRDKPFKIWGHAKNGAVVTITASWQNTPFTTTANAAGGWEAVISATPVNAVAQMITVTTSDEAPLKLENILVGDVWICSGQSNMVMPLGNISTSFVGVQNYQAEIAAANYPLIRSLTVKEDYKGQPVNEFSSPSKWTVCSAGTASGLSAVAYYFARKLHTELNVPIGIIISAVNGTTCDNWVNAAAFQTDPVLKNLYGNSSQGSRLFNGMVNPLTKLAVKGFTWYQGESDQHISPPENYTRLNTALIRGWRTLFNQDELPFYYVQVTPYDYSGTGNILLNDYARFREAQANVRTTVTGTGMAISIDAGDLSNHHSPYKKPVGERLALLALSKTYGRNVQCVGPQYESFTQTGSLLTLNFVNGTANGLNTINNGGLNQYFFVAGTDHMFRQGTAAINGDKIDITIPVGTPLPVMAVRYAFTNFPITNLQNSAGLPVEPFRTDNWAN